MPQLVPSPQPSPAGRGSRPYGTSSILPVAPGSVILLAGAPCPRPIRSTAHRARSQLLERVAQRVSDVRRHRPTRRGPDGSPIDQTKSGRGARGTGGRCRRKAARVDRVRVHDEKDRAAPERAERVEPRHCNRVGAARRALGSDCRRASSGAPEGVLELAETEEIHDRVGPVGFRRARESDTDFGSSEVVAKLHGHGGVARAEPLQAVGVATTTRMLFCCSTAATVRGSPGGAAGPAGRGRRLRGALARTLPVRPPSTRSLAPARRLEPSSTEGATCSGQPNRRGAVLRDRKRSAVEGRANRASAVGRQALPRERRASPGRRRCVRAGPHPAGAAAG